jgi:hypothetical protein
MAGQVLTMSRVAVFAVSLLFVIQAQAQLFSHGVPAGATSPEPNGRQHGIPSNVQSPTPIPPGVNIPGVNVPAGRRFNLHGPLRHFGNPRDHRKAVVPIPVFFPIYGYGEPGYPADPLVQASPDPATDSSSPNSSDSAAAQNQADAAGNEDLLRQAYLQGARDALKDTLQKERDNGRYGEHYMDSREQERSRVSDNKPAPSADQAPAATPVKEDGGPATVFIFKDGHQIETHNFAIMGETLYDFSSTVLKKVQLTDLDKTATVKANDDRGITVKLP